MEIVFQYLDELAEKKETASAQVERNRIGYVLGKKSNHPDSYIRIFISSTTLWLIKAKYIEHKIKTKDCYRARC
ncbi:MAG TPA: hypothetical protein VN040_09000 [Pseudosphingobacterium sp.]|nr:hypothetical protein [Pseudosphingobacterium sp.]